jgi:hypothetical protein
MYGDINTSHFITVIKLIIMFQCFYDVDVDEGYIVNSTYPITSKWNSEERLEVARDYSSLGVGGGRNLFPPPQNGTRHTNSKVNI